MGNKQGQRGTLLDACVSESMVILNFEFTGLVIFSLLSANYSKSGHCHTQLML